jgi:hypothetical protein
MTRDEKIIRNKVGVLPSSPCSCSLSGLGDDAARNTIKPHPKAAWPQPTGAPVGCGHCQVITVSGHKVGLSRARRAQ